MPELTPADAEKVAALRPLRNHGIHVFEVIKITWPGTYETGGGVRYYGATAVHELSPEILTQIDNQPVEPRLMVPADGSDLFLEINTGSALADEDVDIAFGDLDGSFADMFHTYGEGCPIEIFYWFPQVELLLSQWIGHTRPGDGSPAHIFHFKAGNGFRSPTLNTPRRPRGATECQAIFGGLLTTQDEIDHNDCWYNRHIPGGTHGNLDPDTGLAYTSCPQLSPADCTPRLGDTLSYLGANTVAQPITIGQTHGPNTLATSIGNESNLKTARRVVIGVRVVREMDPAQYRPEYNSGHPDQGFVAALFDGPEGPVQSVETVAVNNALIAAEHLNTRNGTLRQSRTSYAPDVSNWSGTVVIFARYGQVNPGQYNANNLRASAVIYGLNNIRVYTLVDGVETYSEMFTTNRAWGLMEILTNRRWGFGLDHRRLVIADWRLLGTWSATTVSFTDPNGNVWVGQRTTFNVDLQERTTDRQIGDICAAGRFTPPFPFLGQIRIMPLTAATTDELDNAPLFTDGTIPELENQRNIIVTDDTEIPQITRSTVSDAELVNQVTLTFEDAARANVERPLVFADKVQQLKAGRASGDTTIKVIPKSMVAIGTTSEAEARRYGWLLLDLGENETGGLRNNLSVTFTTWFAETLGLHQYKIIKIRSRQLDRYGFIYFRVMALNRKPNLQIEVKAQAYPESYYAGLETVVGPGGPTGPGTDSYEAEAEVNEFVGTAVVESDPLCSGDAKVVSLGFDAGEGIDGSLIFNGIDGGDTGARAVLTIVYRSPDARALKVRVNSNPATTINCPASGDGVGTRRVFTNVFLAAGTANTVTIFHQTARCPDIDMIYFTLITIDPGGPCRPAFGIITLEDGRAMVPIQPC